VISFIVTFPRQKKSKSLIVIQISIPLQSYNYNSQRATKFQASLANLNPPFDRQTIVLDPFCLKLSPINRLFFSVFRSPLTSPKTHSSPKPGSPTSKDPVTPRKQSHMTWEYIFASPAFRKSAQNSPDRASPREEPPPGEPLSPPVDGDHQIDSAVLSEEIIDDVGTSPVKKRSPSRHVSPLKSGSPSVIVEEEEEEEEGEGEREKEKSVSGPRSPEHYVDETGLDLEDDPVENEGYQEAFLREFWQTYDDAIGEFVHDRIVRTHAAKPISKEKIMDLTAEPIAQFVTERVTWEDGPKAIEHLSFARNVVRPNVERLGIFL
jgi:hypothetical protein